MPTTARAALRYPSLASAADVPADIANLAADVSVAFVGWYTPDTLVNRPAAGKSGYLFYATDQSALYYDTGVAWVGPIGAIAAGSITSAMIADGTIVDADLAADTLTARVIAANAITASELADDAVDTAAIAALAVTGAKVAAATIDGSTKTVAGTIAGGANFGTVLPTTGLFNGYRFTYFWNNMPYDLVYRADLDATYPWFYVGGPGRDSTGSVSGTWSGFTNLSGSFTLPKAGYYEGGGTGGGGGPSQGTYGMAMALGGVSFGDSKGDNTGTTPAYAGKAYVGVQAAGATVVWSGSNSGVVSYSYSARWWVRPVNIG